MTGGRLIQKKGDMGERIAKAQLSLLGIELIERVATPVSLRPYRDKITGNIIPGVFHVKYRERVSGDIRGVWPGGKSVHCEVKLRDKPRLRHSDIRKHQRDWLDAHDKTGGISLLIWVSGTDIFVLRWPIPDFVKGTGLSMERAREFSII